MYSPKIAPTTLYVAAIRRPAKKDGIAAGSRALCMVRPENLQATPAPREGFNSFEALVRHLRPNGATVTAILDANGVPMKATVLNQPGLNLRPGAKVRWAVDIRHTVVLPS